MMRQTITLIFILLNTLIYAQNLNKCNTTNIMNQEFKTNPDYILAIEEIIKENKEWINKNLVEKNNNHYPYCGAYNTQKHPSKCWVWNKYP